MVFVVGRWRSSFFHQFLVLLERSNKQQSGDVFNKVRPEITGQLPASHHSQRSLASRLSVLRPSLRVYWKLIHLHTYRHFHCVYTRAYPLTHLLPQVSVLQTLVVAAVVSALWFQSNSVDDLQVCPTRCSITSHNPSRCPRAHILELFGLEYM
jgi:hypothetical protein